MNMQGKARESSRRNNNQLPFKQNRRKVMLSNQPQINLRDSQEGAIIGSQYLCTQSDHVTTPPTANQSGSKQQENKVKKLERQIQFKDEIIAKYQELFGGKQQEQNQKISIKQQNMIAQLRERLRERNSQLNQMSDELQKMRVMHHKFENNEQINRNQKALREQITSLSNQNKDLAQKYEKRQKIVQSLQSKIENLNRQMEYRFAEAQNQTLKQSFINREQARMQADALKNQKRELQISRKSLMKRVNALQTENVRVIQERDELESKFNRLLQQSQRQLTDLQCASNQLSILRKNSEQTQAFKIKELNETNANLLKSLSEMKIDLSNALRENNDLQQDLDDYKQANKRLQADLIYLKQSQQREISIIDDKCQHVRNENSKMLEEIKYLREVELEQKKEIRRLEIARDNYKDQYLQIKAEKKQIERACSQKDEELRRLVNNNVQFEFNSSEQKKFQTPLNYGQTMSSNYDSKVRMVTDIKDLITQYKEGKSSKKQQNFRN